MEDTTFEDPPQTLSVKMRQLITGVHKLESGLMHVLDTEKVCTSLETAEAAVGRAPVGGGRDSGNVDEVGIDLGVSGEFK